MEYITDQPKHRNYTNRLDTFWSTHPQELRAGNEPKQTTWEAIQDTYNDYARTFRRYFAALLFLFNLHVVILSVCSCIAVYLCSKKYWNIKCVLAPRCRAARGARGAPGRAAGAWVRGPCVPAARIVPASRRTAAGRRAPARWGRRAAGN